MRAMTLGTALRVCSYLARPKLVRVLVAVLFAATAIRASAQTLTPLATFGGGDGWLSPGEFGYTHLTSALVPTADNQRGLAYNNGHLYLVDKAGGVANIRIL